MSNFRRLFQNERGLSLIEVVASIVIIGIIFISFFGLFVQSGETAKTSEKILRSTYIAQVTMENAFQLSKDIPFSGITEKLQTQGYLVEPNQTYTYTKEDDGYVIHLSFSNRQNNLYSVIVKVYENGQLKSQMENLYKWKGK